MAGKGGNDVGDGGTGVGEAAEDSEAAGDGVEVASNSPGRFEVSAGEEPIEVGAAAEEFDGPAFVVGELAGPGADASGAAPLVRPALSGVPPNGSPRGTTEVAGEARPVSVSATEAIGGGRSGSSR